MQISTLLLAGAAAAAALPAPDDTPKKPVFDISAPVFDPPNVTGAPSTPSFTGTCEGETTAESPDQSSFVDCAANRQKGEFSDGGTFEGPSARVQPNDNRKPNVTISFKWIQQISNKKYSNTAGVMDKWVVGQPEPEKFDIPETVIVQGTWV
ncbi:hypothetical protein PG985_003005 [Apiospora marii]|uniref:Uncharacterized protein n=1 Tax=Apiospora marii TaxID=335849 RepID=A0ABR1RUD3_9PEZI